MYQRISNKKLKEIVSDVGELIRSIIIDIKDDIVHNYFGRIELLEFYNDVIERSKLDW
jgi:hypothetical protein